MTFRVKVAIVLLSGMARRGFCICAVNEGNGLEFIVKWLSPLVDLRQMYKKTLRCTTKYIILSLMDLSKFRKI